MINYSYFTTNGIPKKRRRSKRKRVSDYDPNAKKADKDYKDNFGL